MMSVVPQKSTLDHVLQVLGNKIYNAVFSIAGVRELDDLWLCDLPSLRQTVVNIDKTEYVMNLVQYGMLVRLFEYNVEHQFEDEDEWFNLTSADLRKTQFKPRSTNVTNQIPTSPGILSGVRRSLSDYPKLREDKMWLSFNRTILALAASHDLSEVFDVDYVPQPNDEMEFKRKNIFVYSMFTYSLISAKAKVALRAHESTMDAQLVYKDLLAAYSDGTAAHLSAEALETQIQAMKLDNTWNKPTETFLHTWAARLHDLESI